MSFTDEQLKLLKEAGPTDIWINRKEWTPETLKKFDISSLVERLEAAEDAVIAFHIIPKSNWTERIRLAVEKWFKVCGK